MSTDKCHITMTSHTRHGIPTHWQLYCLLNSSFRQIWKKTSSRHFVRGIHQRWNRHALDHTSIPGILCNGNTLVISGFTAHMATNVINYGMKNYITVTKSEFNEFSTRLHLHCLFKSSFGHTNLYECPMHTC